MTLKILICAFIFTGCCTIADFESMVSLTALTILVILISQYIGMLKYKIEKSRAERR